MPSPRRLIDPSTLHELYEDAEDLGRVLLDAVNLTDPAKRERAIARVVRQAAAEVGGLAEVLAEIKQEEQDEQA